MKIIAENIINNVKLPPCGRCGNEDAEINYNDSGYFSIFCEECHLFIDEKDILKVLDLWEKGQESEVI